MKSITKALLSSIFGLVVISASVRASATEILKVTALENSPVIRMEISDPSLKEINLYLFDQNNRAVFRDRVDPGSTFETSFDFSETVNGTYKLVSEMGHMKFNRIFSVSESKVRLVDSFYSFSPQFALEDGKMLVQYINSVGNSIGVAIENVNENSVIFEDFYGTTPLTFSKVFDVDHLNRGDYKLTLSTGGEFYAYDFSID